MKLVIIILIIVLFFVLINTNCSREMFLTLPTLGTDNVQSICIGPNGKAIECCDDDGLVGGQKECCQVRSNGSYNNC